MGARHPVVSFAVGARYLLQNWKIRHGIYDQFPVLRCVHQNNMTEVGCL
jgi:hypothetical protein